MVHVRRSKRINLLFFGNILTQYLRKEEVDEDLKFEMIILAPLQGTDIASIQAKEDNDMMSIMLVMIASWPIFMGCSTCSYRLGGGQLLWRSVRAYMRVIHSMLMPSIWLGLVRVKDFLRMKI